MASKQYVWHVPGGRMTVMAVGEEGDESYFIDNDRPLRADATPLVAMTPDRIDALHYVLRFAEIGVGHDQYDSDLRVVKELLKELENTTNGTTE